MISVKSISKKSNKTIPGFLVLLFFVEMWERFSYYGMRALLVLFLTSVLGFADKNAYATYALFATISYSLPIFGGFLADKIMGFRNMIFIGGIIIIIGHIAMAFSEHSIDMIFLGLGLIGTGTGFFKGNITNLLGSCYTSDIFNKNNKIERDRGFTLFYTGINLGSFMASIACGYVADIYGWHYGFGLAGIGMAFGLILFIKFQKILSDVGISPRQDLITKRFFGLKPFSWVLICGISFSFICARALAYSELFVDVLKYFGALVLLYYIHLIYKSKPKVRINLYIIAIMIVFLMMFFALEMQLGALINLFTERNVEKVVLGISIPASVSQAINPISVMIIGFIFSTIINFKKSLDTYRIALSILSMAMCFFVLYFGCIQANSDGLVNYMFLIIGISLMGLGEILIAPMIQSYISLLAPDKQKGLIMGIMMLSLAFSNLAGMIIAEFMSIPSIDGQINNMQSLEIYKAGFFDIAMFNIYITIIFVPFGIYMNKKLLYRKRVSKEV